MQWTTVNRTLMELIAQKFIEQSFSSQVNQGPVYFGFVTGGFA